jgi:Rps23 Pro-64 3,4-dihydroxylase Tpa1-like proline 4-hydroxylase
MVTFACTHPRLRDRRPDPAPRYPLAGSPGKRQKVPGTAGAAARAPAAPIIRPSLLADAPARAALAADYAAAQPYPHCVIPAICDPARLLAVRDEIIDNVAATYKETDLFKMLQTGDLANMDKLDPASAAKLPNLLALRDAIYSPQFRALVTELTGCGDLSDRTDCACNVHPLGGHLLCHDDVIGDRRVSYIVYLTDPDSPWTAQDGGALELYPQAPGAPHTPATTPTAAVLPAWNTMAVFTVQPGRSFHAIQEVVAGDKPRMSIQGWFHAPAPPEDAQLATLCQLQARPGEGDEGAYDAFLGAGGAPESTSTSDNPALDSDLTDEDLAALVQWVNPVYLGEDAAAKVAAQFREEGSVQLRNFLRRDRAAAVLAAIEAADAAAGVGGARLPAYGAGEGGGWAAAGPAHKQRYLRYCGPAGGDEGSGAGAPEGAGAAEAQAAGALLEEIRRGLFGSAAFARLVRRLTTLALAGHRAEVRRFRAGLDYTVAHYGGLTRDPRLDAVLCFVADGAAGGGGREAWEGGEVGGFEAYVLADEEEEAGPAEVYRGGGDDEGGVLNVAPAPNSLNLVLRDEGLMRFVKYVSCQAPGSRWDVAAAMLPQDDSEDEWEEDAGEGEEEE